MGSGDISNLAKKRTDSFMSGAGMELNYMRSVESLLLFW